MTHVTYGAVNSYAFAVFWGRVWYVFSSLRSRSAASSGDALPHILEDHAEVKKSSVRVSLCKCQIWQKSTVKLFQRLSGQALTCCVDAVLEFRSHQSRTAMAEEFSVWFEHASSIPNVPERENEEWGFGCFIGRGGLGFFIPSQLVCRAVRCCDHNSRAEAACRTVLSIFQWAQRWCQVQSFDSVCLVGRQPPVMPTLPGMSVSHQQCSSSVVTHPWGAVLISQAEGIQVCVSCVPRGAQPPVVPALPAACCSGRSQPSAVRRAQPPVMPALPAACCSGRSQPSAVMHVWCQCHGQLCFRSVLQWEGTFWALHFFGAVRPGLVGLSPLEVSYFFNHFYFFDGSGLVQVMWRLRPNEENEACLSSAVVTWLIVDVVIHDLQNAKQLWIQGLGVRSAAIAIFTAKFVVHDQFHYETKQKPCPYKKIQWTHQKHKKNENNIKFNILYVLFLTKKLINCYINNFFTNLTLL